MNNSIHQILKEYWGFNSFRAGQEAIIESILAGKDTLALLPTGAGKSLCYQVPAMAKDGFCLVISPLIALMKDQVQNLRKKNITAFAIYSGMTRKEVLHTLKTVISSNCKFLYVSPERLETNLFKEYLLAMDINLVAVDEAHCISQWGYDFRPSYLRIASIREELPGIPLIALTASATPDVQKDICDKLNVSPTGSLWNIFRQPFERANISYSVFRVESRISKIIDILNRVNGSAIVYCKSRKRTQEIADAIRLQQISADFYHAGLIQEERNRKQEEWIANKIRVIVCTNAFGMGIDKPDVRLVIHADPPDCLENYYQESGRAGRDGKTSFAILLYDDSNIAEMEEMIEWKYPSESALRNVYQAVANYLQIPAGGGQGQYYDFNMTEFLLKFKLSSYKTLYALKSLEQEGWLSFNEQVFLPSMVQFTTNKSDLYQFELHNPQLEPLMKALLRTYEGIFDYPTIISEIVIANLMNRDAAEIKEELNILHRRGMIEYRAQKDNPQIYFLRNRSRVEDLFINMPAYEQRKLKFLTRVNEMIRYIREEQVCRSRFLGAYFGDAELKDCGICDNCFRRKKASISKEEFEMLHHRILNTVKYESLPASELLSKLPGINKEKAWKVIELLMAENKIGLDNSGRVMIK